jgi:hypothetical protein
MASQVDIYNLALDAIGTRSTVTLITEGSAEANALNRHWDAARRAVLAASNWAFSRQQMSLALYQDATAGGTVPSPWLYEYSTPSNLVHMRYILPMFDNIPGVASGASVATFSGPPIKFVMSSDVDANGNDINVILTNQPQAIAVYTKDVKETNLCTDGFVEALRMYLGHRIAIALTGDKQLSGALYQQATEAIRAAEAQNNNEGLTVNESVPDWMRVRGYVSDFGYPGGDAMYYSPSSLVMVS